MALPHGTTGSLSPAFTSARRIGSRSQASLCPYTLRTIANRAEDAFGLLRYSLGGDRPSQTAHLALSDARIHGCAVRRLVTQGWYFNVGSIPAGTGISKPPTYPTHVTQDANTRLQ